MNNLSKVTREPRMFLHSVDKKSTLDAAAASVRDHIEKVVESIVGENLDCVNVIRISADPNCENQKERFPNRPCLILLSNF